MSIDKCEKYYKFNTETILPENLQPHKETLMPIRFTLPTGTVILRVHGEWCAEGFEDTTPSLILAYSACFADGMQLGEMAGAMRKDDLSITDFADEEISHVISFLEERVEEEYVRLSEADERSNSRERIADILLSLEEMRQDLCREVEHPNYPALLHTLEQAIIRFANLLANKQIQQTMGAT